MATSLYSGFVPVCLQLLAGLKTVLKKAEEHTAYIEGSGIYRHESPGIIHKQAEQECNAVQAEEKRNCQAKEGVQSV